MYFHVEGEAIVSLPDGAVTMREGDVLRVAAGGAELVARGGDGAGVDVLFAHREIVVFLP